MMKSSKNDASVKKTLIRNSEHSLKTPHEIIHETEPSRSHEKLDKNLQYFERDNLSKPSLCSSEVFFNYLNDVKKSATHHHPEDIEKKNICAKVTKKLNFHFNDKIYKNLIELNSNIENVKSKKVSRPSSNTGRVKKDLEPNIDDFYENSNEQDTPPKIPMLKLKFKPVNSIEKRNLHKLVSSFET